MSKGFTIVELMVVIVLIGIVFAVADIGGITIFSDKRLETSLYKMKADIDYVQSKKMASNENYMVAFGTTVSGVTGINFDYVCFNDEDGNRSPSLSEVLTDSFSRKKMMYKLSNSEYSDSAYKDVTFEEVKIFNSSMTEVSNPVIWFDKLGGIRVFSGGAWQEIGENETNHNYIEMVDKTGAKKELKIYPVSSEMEILNK